MKKYFGVVLFLIVTVIFLSGCVYDLVIPESDLNSEDTEDGVVPGKGTLKIYLTDAPGDYLEVNIIISKIEGHIAGNGEEGEDKGSWEKLKEWDEGLLINLIELEDVSILLASLELEPNKYTQLRLFLEGDEEEDAWIVLNDSGLAEKPLEIPSVYQTGIKLNRSFEIVAGMITKLTIDFDAEKSVVKTGNGKYKLKPVIHVTSEMPSEEDIDTGLVYGTVSYYGGENLGLIGIGGASVSLSGGEYIFVYNTTTSEDGSFNFIENVPIGNCVLNVYADGFDDYSKSIVVKNGEDTVVDIILSFEETGVISGSVVNLANSSPIEGATVTVTLSGGSTYNSFDSFTGTDTEGSFSIEQLPVGIYDLTVSADTYDDNDISGIDVAADAIKNIGTIKLTQSVP